MIKKRGHQFNDIAGQQFGKLTVISIDSKNKWGRYNWKCLCDCGKEIIVEGAALRGNHTKSCGCLRYLYIPPNKTHDMSETRFYKAYCGIKKRCGNKNSSGFIKYGAKGIKCLWRSFDEFKKDMYVTYQEHVKKYGEKNTQIDRINVLGNYEHSNCRWVTITEQSRNKTNTKYINYRGENKSLADWCDDLNLNRGLVSSRLQRGWSIEQSFTKK